MCLPPKLLISLKQSSFIMEDLSRSICVAKGWQVYPTWKCGIHICLWIGFHLNSDVFRLKLQSPISTLHAPLQGNDSLDINTTEPRYFKQHSLDKSALKHFHSLASGRPAILGSKLQDLYPTTDYYPTHLQVLCFRIALYMTYSKPVHWEYCFNTY